MMASFISILGYVAVGLSADDHMGDDFIMACLPSSENDIAVLTGVTLIDKKTEMDIQ